MINIIEVKTDNQSFIVTNDFTGVTEVIFY